MNHSYGAVAAAFILAGCSLTLDFSECSTDDDCASNGRCVEGVCETGGGGGDDVGTTDGSTDDMRSAIDMGGEDDSGGMPNDSGMTDTGGSDTADADPDRPTGRTVCPERPVSDITDPKNTVGDGNATSCTFDALTTAIAEGGLITFECGPDPHTITFDNRIVIDRDVHIDGGGVITFDGGDSTRLITLDTSFQSDTPRLVLEDLTLQNGYAATDETFCGAAVHRTGGTLTVIDSTFENNRCDATTNGENRPVGGALAAVDGGPLTVFGSEFTNNLGGGGGAIYVRDTEVEITNTTFESNQAADLSGGALTSFDQTAMTICGCEFRENESQNFGGGIFYWDRELPRASLTISQTTFDQNIAIEDGGGADLEGADLRIDTTTFSANVAEQGGGLWLGDDEFEMVNVTFHANEATNEAGGAIYYSDSSGRIEHGTFVNNISSAAPGAVLGSSPDADPSVTFRNTILADTRVEPAAMLCTVEQTDEGGVIQWPDDTEPCVPGAELGNPMVDELSQNGGLTETIVPSAEGVAADAADSCPRFDQRGIVRPRNACTTGAVQLEE